MGKVMNLEAGLRMIEAAKKKATEIGIPMVIAIVDRGGNLIALQRMDGASLVSLDIAKNKAYTAVATQMPTGELAKLAQPGAELFGLDKTNGGRIIVFAGGFPIKADGEIVGGIGVSGGPVSDDAACAQAGLTAF
jgi:uncharacterized protein GlcG (DUF336 family)